MDAVSPETVRNYFEHSGFSKRHQSELATEVTEELDFDSWVDVDAVLTAREVNAEATEEEANEAMLRRLQSDMRTSRLWLLRRTRQKHVRVYMYC